MSDFICKETSDSVIYPVGPMPADKAPFDPSLRGVALLKAIYNFIFTHQEQWYQQNWKRTVNTKDNQYTCGTAFCFGGWMVYVCGTDYLSIENRGVALFGLHRMDVDWLFQAYRTLDEIHHFVKTKIQGYDEDGLLHEEAALIP